MADFPDVQLPSKRKRVFQKPQYRAKFADGAVATRSKYSKGKWKFTLDWDLLPESDFDRVQAHFDANQGGEFVCAKEMLNTAIDMTVTYLIDDLAADSTKAPGRYKVKIVLEEA